MGSPAVAVEREMVGRDRVAAVICAEGPAGCCMAWRACCAESWSFDFGDDDEKNWESLIPLDWDGRRSAVFSAGDMLA